MSYIQELECHLSNIDALLESGSNQSRESYGYDPWLMTVRPAKLTKLMRAKVAQDLEVWACQRQDFFRSHRFLLPVNASVIIVDIYDHPLPQQTICVCWYPLGYRFVVTTLDHLDSM